MDDSKLAWRAGGAGKLWAEAGGHIVSVDQLFPAADARFVLWAANQGPPLASGTRSSAREAMTAVEQILARLTGRDEATAASRIAAE